MTDWKLGQRFKLEVEGEFRHSELSGQNTNWTFFDLPDVWAKDGNTFVAYKEWFDEHATKIQKPFKFGNTVWFRGEDADFYKAVVLRGAPDEAMIWIQGAVGPRNARNDKLTLIETEAT